MAAPGGLIARRAPDGGPLLPTGKGRLRAFRPDDIPDVVALRRRAFRFSERVSPEALAAYLERVFCHHPWPDEELPSLVYQDEYGRLVGFLGVIPRPMRFQGEDIRAAVATQLMVAPESRGLTGRFLARAFFCGPQDLSLSDTANDAARRLWVSIGGSVSVSHSLSWLRPLRPARLLGARVAARGLLPRALSFAARPLLNAVDALTARGGKAGSIPVTGVMEPLDPAVVAEAAEEVLGGYALRPAYAAAAVAWLIDHAAEKRSFGRLEGMQVRLSDGQVAGWFLCYANSGGISQVVQLAARPSARAMVLAHLCQFARARGASAVEGRLDPALLPDLAAQRARLGHDGPWVLFHSPRPEILHAIECGDAFLSRLDGEWWLSF